MRRMSAFAAGLLLGITAAFIPPPTQGIFCFKLDIPMAVKIHQNMTVLNMTHFGYALNVAEVLHPAKDIAIDCKAVQYAYVESTGQMDVTKELADPNSCLSKLRIADENTTTLQFVWDGTGVTVKDDSKSPKLLPQSGALCPT